MTGQKIMVKVKLLSPDAQVPTMAKSDDAAFDLYSTVNCVIEPGERFAVPIGLSLEIPPGYEGQVRPRSGMALKHGVTVLNSPGTIDSGYRGEVMSTLINLGQKAFKVTKGMRVAQLAIRSVPDVTMEKVELLSESDRGEGGFGSTGL